jgi:hypothetical protein
MRQHGAWAALMALVFSLVAHGTRAGEITFTAQVIATQPGNGGFFTVLNGTGAATAISGFPSLQGVAPSDVTFTLSNFHQTQFIVTPTLIDESFGGTPGQPATFQFFQSGNLIGETTNPVIHLIVTNTSPLPAHATATLPLTAPSGSAFLEDVINQTGGSGILHGLTDPFNPGPTGDSATFDLTGIFATAPTAVPEPASLTLLLLGCVGVVGYVRRWR